MNPGIVPIQSEKAIFLAALDVADERERQAFLDQACGGDLERRRKVERLLAADDAGGSSPLDDAVEHSASAETCGTEVDTSAGFDIASHPIIDRYKLLEQIGEGGMGAVFMAQQTVPVNRKVALKVIKAGMDSKEVIARFEAERQALAMMDHPHIAKVLDGGTTDQERPYFVMELVQGLPINEYCDAKRLTTRERLELFIDVCRAVQHAHQKGIIHRDLKPSNILVAEIDGKAVPKVIDFGVAKALSQKLTDQTVYTQFSQMIGTPLYMSPEQAGLGVIDIDTRSDIYSLGVVLYELLTGETPFDREKLREVSFDEMRRMIREDEPKRPSAMASTMAAAAQSTVANRRRNHPHKLSQSLAGELDWLLLKALEKDRERRYESASSLAQDIQRYLQDEPIIARPPSFAYRLSKFSLRNRGRLIAGSLAACLILVGLLFGVSAKLQQDRSSRQLAADVQASLSAARAAIDSEDLLVAARYISEARGRLGGTGNERLVALVQQLDAELNERRHFERFQQLSHDALQVKPNNAGGTHDFYLDVLRAVKEALSIYDVLKDEAWYGKLKKSYLSLDQQSEVRKTAYQLLLLFANYNVRYESRGAEHAQESLDYLRRAALFHEPTRAFFFVRSECHRYLKNREQMEQDLTAFKEARAVSAFDYYLPGHTPAPHGRREEALEAYEAALRIQPDHFNSLFYLAWHQGDANPTEAAALFRACLALDPNNRAALLHRADALAKLGEFDEALELISKASDLYGDSAFGAIAYGVRSSIYVKCKEYQKALEDSNAAHAIATSEGSVVEAGILANIYAHQGIARYRMGKYGAAIKSFTKANELSPAEYPEKACSSLFLAMSHWQIGHRAEALPWLERGKKEQQDVTYNHFMPSPAELQALQQEAEKLLEL